LREKIEKSIETMAGRALRTICLAYRDVSPREDFNTKDKKGVFDVETHDLTLIAVLGIKDLPRPEVPRAITLCRLAGIKVRMVTGDNQLTARAIAKEIGIIEPGNENSLVMEGPAFIAAIGGVICKNCRTYVCHCPRDS
jgi:Ca2+ transporting ATPase